MIGLHTAQLLRAALKRKRSEHLAPCPASTNVGVNALLELARKAIAIP